MIGLTKPDASAESDRPLRIRTIGRAPDESNNRTGNACSNSGSCLRWPVQDSAGFSACKYWCTPDWCHRLPQPLEIPGVMKLRTLADLRALLKDAIQGNELGASYFWHPQCSHMVPGADF